MLSSVESRCPTVILGRKISRRQTTLNRSLYYVTKRRKNAKTVYRVDQFGLSKFSVSDTERPHGVWRQLRAPVILKRKELQRWNSPCSTASDLSKTANRPGMACSGTEIFVAKHGQTLHFTHICQAWLPIWKAWWPWPMTLTLCTNI